MLLRHIIKATTPATRALAVSTRALATQPSALHVFDQATKHAQRERANAPQHADQSRVVDYLRDEVAERMVDRLLDIKRTFGTVVDLGAGSGHLAKFLDEDMLTGRLIQCDTSSNALYRDVSMSTTLPLQQRVDRVLLNAKQMEGVEALPFDEGSVDAVLSSMSLHWVNDLPSLFRSVQNVLKPDTPFIGAMLGGDTLFELRCAFQLAELEREGGLSPHVSPFASAPDVSGLLNDAGFTLTTIDIDEIVVNYPTPFELMSDLQAMAENNAVFRRRKPALSRDTLIAMSAIYKEMYANEDGTIPATFQVLYFIGWKPDPSQPKPIKRGSGQVSLKDLDNLKAK